MAKFTLHLEDGPDGELNYWFECDPPIATRKEIQSGNWNGLAPTAAQVVGVELLHMVHPIYAKEFQCGDPNCEECRSGDVGVSPRGTEH